MVFLSATLSNASEFADWVASVHLAPCHVVYTEFRPTPLRHYAYPSGGEGLYLVREERGNRVICWQDKPVPAYYHIKILHISQLQIAFLCYMQVLNEFGEFREDNFKKLQASLTGDDAQAGEKGNMVGSAKKPRKKTDAERANDLRKIVKLIKASKFDPVIVFSFSRRWVSSAQCVHHVFSIGLG